MREQGAHSRKKEHHVGDLEAEQSLELREVQGPLSTSMSPNNQHELNPPGRATPDYKDIGNLAPALSLGVELGRNELRVVER